MHKWVEVGKTMHGTLYVEVEFNGKRLSIMGVEGPQQNGNCRGSCGQCIDALADVQATPLVNVARLREVWETWHLNDMRAGCEHQRALWADERIEVVSYKLTRAALVLRRAAEKEAAEAASLGVVASLSETARALLACEWFREIFSPPDADSPLSGCYEVSKRESKAAGWVKPDEHPKGLLGRACAVCGYKYGTAWLHEEVPLNVIAFLELLPESTSCPWPLR